MSPAVVAIRLRQAAMLRRLCLSLAAAGERARERAGQGPPRPPAARKRPTGRG